MDEHADRFPAGTVLAIGLALAVGVLVVMPAAAQQSAAAATSVPSAPVAVRFTAASGGASADNVGTLAQSPTSPDQQFPLGGTDMQAAQQIAIQFWEMTPCRGNVTLVWDTLDKSVNATTTWWNPTAAYGNAERNNHCVVTFNKAQSMDWPMFCSLTVHEYGHLTGHEHVNDPSNVMYPGPLQPVSQCQVPLPRARRRPRPTQSAVTRPRHPWRAGTAATTTPSASS